MSVELVATDPGIAAAAPEADGVGTPGSGTAPGRRSGTPLRSVSLWLTVLPLLILLGWAVLPGLFTDFNPISGIPNEHASRSLPLSRRFGPRA